MQLSIKPPLASRVYEVEDFAAAQELYHANGWTDGLPVVPPTQAAVEACLEWAGMAPDQLLGIEPVRALPITAEKLAINAVMAGCLPMHFPVVATAWQAMLREEVLLHGVTSSTGGCAILVILNGPIRLEIGANATFNALGNSDRATAVIGRALRLALINLMDVRPGGIDRSTLGHPGKFSYCLAEDEEDTSWLPLSVVRGMPPGASAVTVMAAMAPRQIMNEWTTDPREILETFAAEMRANQLHLLDLRRQLRDRHPQAAARAHPGRRLEQAGRGGVPVRARAGAPRRLGRRRQGRGGARPGRQGASGARLPRRSAGGGRGRAGGRLRRRHRPVDGQQDQGRDGGDRRLRRLRAAETRRGREAVRP